MAKTKTVVKKTTKPVAKGNKTTATTAVNSSSAPAPKKSEKAPEKKPVPKTPLETKTVCFTDQETGKKFCGEVTEAPPAKATKKVAGTRRRKR